MPNMSTDPPIEYGTPWDWTTSNPSRYHRAVVSQNSSSYAKSDYWVDADGNGHWPSILFHASAQQVRDAYSALTGQGRPENFNQRVWNDMVDKIVELQDTWEVGRTYRLDREDTEYPYYHATQIQGGHSPYISSAEPGYTEAHYSDYQAKDYKHWNIGHSLNADKFNMCVNAFITLPSNWKWEWEKDNTAIRPGTLAYGRYILELFRAINHWCYQLPQYVNSLQVGGSFEISNINPRLADALHIKVDDFDWITTIETKQVWLDDSILITPPTEFLQTFETKINPVVLDYLNIQRTFHFDPELVCQKAEMAESRPMFALNLNAGEFYTFRVNTLLFDSVQIPIHLEVQHHILPNTVMLESLPFTEKLIYSETGINIIDVPVKDSYPTAIETLIFDNKVKVNHTQFGESQKIESLKLYTNSGLSIRKVEASESWYLTGMKDNLSVTTTAPLTYGNFLNMESSTTFTTDVSTHVDKAPTVMFTGTSDILSAEVVTAKMGSSYNFDTIVTYDWQMLIKARLGSSVRLHADLQALINAIAQLRASQLLQMPEGKALLDYLVQSALNVAKQLDLTSHNDFTSVDFVKALFGIGTPLSKISSTAEIIDSATTNFGIAPTVFDFSGSTNISQQSTPPKLRIDEIVQISDNISEVEVKYTTKLGTIQYLEMSKSNATIEVNTVVKPSHLQNLDIEKTNVELTIKPDVKLITAKVPGTFMVDGLIKITPDSMLGTVQYVKAHADTDINAVVNIIDFTILHAANCFGEENLTVQYYNLFSVQKLRELQNASNDILINSFTGISTGMPKFIQGHGIVDAFNVNTKFAYQDGVHFYSHASISSNGTGLPELVGSLQLPNFNTDLIANMLAPLDKELSNAWKRPVKKFIDGKQRLIIYQVHTTMPVGYNDIIRIDSMYAKEILPLVTYGLFAIDAKAVFEGRVPANANSDIINTVNALASVENAPDWARPRWNIINEALSLTIYQAQDASVPGVADTILRIDATLKQDMPDINAIISETSIVTGSGYFNQYIKHTQTNIKIQVQSSLDSAPYDGWTEPTWNVVNSNLTLTIHQAMSKYFHRTSDRVLRIDSMIMSQMPNINTGVNTEVITNEDITNSVIDFTGNSSIIDSENTELYDGKWRYAKYHAPYAILTIYQLTTVVQTNDNIEVK